MERAAVRRFSYQSVAPLDWFQFRCLLWEALPAVPADAPDRWDRVAELVNRTCPRSLPCEGPAIEKVFRSLGSHKPTLRETAADARHGMRIWNEMLYEIAHELFDHPVFMNLGYVPLGGEQPPALHPEDEPFRLFIQLYHRVIDGLGLRGKRVLEVGCGSGGGASYIHRYHGVSELVGIDRVTDNIDTCRRLHRRHGLTFELGDAESIPSPDESHDAVVSIEATGACPSVEGFFSEVRRVLRPGGTFLFADLRPTKPEWGPGRTVGDLPRLLGAAGLKIVRSSNITPNVLVSLDRQETARRTILQGFAEEPNNLSHFLEIMLAQGSLNRQKLESGEIQYLAFVCRK